MYSDAIAPWSTWMSKILRCLVDLPKLELSRKAHIEIRKRGLNLRLSSPKFRKYHVERIPVLVSGFDRPETTNNEYYNDSKEDEAHHENCSPHNPCKTCKEIKNNILKPSSEESDDEKSKCTADEETSYLSSEESDTDWDDPHNGEHPNCTECEEIREDDCEDPECNEHGAGDIEGYEEPPEETENHGNSDDTRPINSDEAEEITEVIERLQKETEKASGLAANALKGLKATNETTQAVKDHLEKEMVKQAEAYRSLSTDYSQLSAENARVRDQAEKVKKDLAKINSASQNIPEAESKWTHHHSAPGKKIKDFVCLEEIERKIECSCDKIYMENSRTKMNHAIQGLKDAIRCQNSGNGKTIKSGDKTYVNCHKAHGKKLFVIIKYAVGLPGIGEEILEIWRNLLNPLTLSPAETWLESAVS